MINNNIRNNLNCQLIVLKNKLKKLEIKKQEYIDFLSSMEELNTELFECSNNLKAVYEETKNSINEKKINDKIERINNYKENNNIDSEKIVEIVEDLKKDIDKINNEIIQTNKIIASIYFKLQS